MANVFLSYVRENKLIVDRLTVELRTWGVSVWLDRDALGPGARWQDEIETAIANGDFFLACFSPEYAQRDKTHMNEELTVAIDVMRQRPRSRAWFIPVLINGGHIPNRRISSVEHLQDLNAVDLSDDWSAGVQKILKVLGHEDPNLARALSLVDVARRFDTPEGLQSIMHLGELRFADKRVLQVLIDATTLRTDERVKSAAANSLAEIGHGAAPALGAALLRADEDSRTHILRALRQIGPGAGAAVPDIISLLQTRGPSDPDESGWFTTVEQRAIRTLGAIGSHAEVAVPHLSTLLRASSRKLRTIAAFALTQIGEKSVPSLAGCFNDPVIRRDVVAGILWADRTGGTADAVFALAGSAQAVSGLVDVLNGDHRAGKNITHAAINAISKFGADATMARPALMKLRKSCQDWRDRELLEDVLRCIRRRPRRRGGS